ncbi:MAG: histidine--tRNA ligase [Bacteroidetes bacterium]|nr:histidine--tRNA ligase [Bacteroidota bacterium]
MAAQKPSIPRGMRDFGPLEMQRRNYIFDSIRSVFQLYGYQPIETPSMENLSTLMGKYGEEGDKLLFKVLNSGNYIEKATEESYLDYKKLTSVISEKGLRYDLTVPFARYIVMNRNEIVFPFKRYQIQPVWRADKPQKGRYREFYQCDVDVIGSNSLLNEAELVKVTDVIFNKLGILTIIKINNRKILAGIAEVIGFPEKIIDICIAIDKMDKIGLEKVNTELMEKGLTAKAIEILQPILQLKGNNAEKTDIIRNFLNSSAIGIKGIEEITTVFEYIESIDIKAEVELDLTLARGLNYYTGAIFEVKAKDVQIGSICGGGRYDDLCGIFGMPDTSGVGISFGADRIYDVMAELQLFPKEVETATKVLFINFSEKEISYCLPLATSLRNNGISTEIYPEAAKLKKQFSYADAKKIPFVIIIGEEEMKNDSLKIKDMNSGNEVILQSAELISYFSKML